MKKRYDEDSIQSLSPLEFTRLRPQVYCGSTEYSTQLLVEIISNSIDEYRLGNGNTIEVKIDTKDNSITVTDEGQGFIPNSKREDGKTVLEAAFSVLNTSGKYKDDGVYEGTSLGSFGIGSKLIVFLSHFARIKSWRDGLFETVYFKEGVFDSRVIGDVDDKLISGTEVYWVPSEDFFTNTEVDLPKVRELFRTIVCLCKGLTINLTIDDKTESFYSKNGINDLVDAAVEDKEIINNRCIMEYANGKNKMEAVLTYTTNYSSTIVPYVNTGLTESGPHITQLKSAITKEFNKFFKENNWLKDKDENLTGDDIQEGMYFVFNITTAGVAYDAQQKSRVTKIDMKGFINEFSNQLNTWLHNNEREIKALAEKAITARKAREAAKKARDVARETEKKKKEKVLKFDSKLADCYSKDRMKCEIYITEGDSASGNIKLARNNEFQACLPVRGKILNTQKATIAQIQKNAEIMTMIDAFGLKIDLKTMKITYDKEDLRYGKIIIMSDADVSNTAYERLFA
jgi:DNA gyrase/topoisomerase IV subunit B